MREECPISDSIKQKVLCAESIAIWPLDPNPLSEPYQIARYLQDRGFHLYPINDFEDKLLEEICYRDIRLIPDDYDILLLFTQSDSLPEVVNAIFNADYQPPLIWTHRGIHDQFSFDRLTEGGITTVMDSNLMEHYKEWTEEEESDNSSECP
ncbi:MAG: CoA-binding protein [bacterium]